MKTFAELDLEVSINPRASNALGAFQNPATIDPTTKTRSYAASAYYGPEIIVERKRADSTATGIEIVTKDGKTERILAREEVILAARALQTPQILELIGIGGKILL
ncbi:hypothetical protein B0H67DRAFT_687960 [Lasiosphaeris hirsuta]|uniref:Glucose-methanol-choline oxidoreductase N-terminal domain-containing protein n=1 Tax=Lasiosphaeris hirsuta TaxID=260670 RepID=A0AA39ZR58_9PEZI|nr:hypothetical protein B0H67DRAFT_687960 [Lasiosphaeris hirsuta]